MAFGKPNQVAFDRVATIAAQTGTRRSSANNVIRPPTNRDMRKKKLAKETPTELAQRRFAKTVNFSCTIVARLIFIGIAGFYFWDLYQQTGMPNRGGIITMLAMFTDLGRVISKAMTHGTK